MFICRQDRHRKSHWIVTQTSGFTDPCEIRRATNAYRNSNELPSDLSSLVLCPGYKVLLGILVSLWMAQYLLMPTATRSTLAQVPQHHTALHGTDLWQQNF